MPETFTSALVTEKNKIHQLYPYVWLVEADLDGTNCIRIAGHDQSVSYDSKTWTPFPVMIGTLPRDAEGSLPLIDLTVSNVSREVAGYLESGGIIDRTVHIYLVNTNALTTGIDWGVWTVQRAQLQLPHAVFQLGNYNLFDAPFPARRQHRSRCDVTYGGLECGYDTTLTNLVSGTYPTFSISSCDYTMDGGNGCRNHGHNEVANGRPRLHPARFGGEPGIPRGPARV